MYQIPTGTKDVLPADISKWHYIEERITDVMRRFNYKEIRTPLFEYTELFSRSIGEATDVVGKEMYTFMDKGGESLTLRPEMTASVMRAYIQNSLGAQQGLTKVYYLGPMFRQERPQKGRLRQFHQFGVEAIGSSAPETDVETMLVALTIYEELGIRDLQFIINSVGCPRCRPPYRQTLTDFLRTLLDQLSPESRRRLETNPMRILDSKNESDIALTQDAPLIHDYLCGECGQHFEKVKKILTNMNIRYTVDGRLVRGLDYYTKTAYEIQSSHLGSQNALGGGGRYDLLCSDLGGKETPAVGFAAGMERLILVMESMNLAFGPRDSVMVYIAALGDVAREAMASYLQALRHHGIAAEMDYLSRSLKAQMRDANRLNARFVVIVGDDELLKNECTLKNMENGEQQTLSLDALLPVMEKELTRA